MAAEGVAEEDDFGADEAFIDTTRCTTCNECTARFPAVFEYDDNKQARFVEGAALPFAALVAAAEKCPARCIFPGAPRDDDDTVDDALLARARELA